MTIQAHKMLETAFKLEETFPTRTTPTKPLKEMTEEELLDERLLLQSWIYSSNNDGRLTAGSSADLDHHWDLIEEIDELLGGSE